MRWLTSILLLSGCSLVEPSRLCPTDDLVLAPGEAPLTCGEARAAVRYTAVVAGRGMSRADRNLLLTDLRARYATHPDEVRTDLAAMRKVVVDLASLDGLAAAEARSTAAWLALDGQGPLAPARYPQAHRVVGHTLAAWVVDDDEKLVFSEADIEGWISYASLCREVQAGGTLKLSIAHREVLYRDLKMAFSAAERPDQVAMVAMGPFWRGISDKWKAASYDKQQAWIRNAPLPPPMTGTSMAYASAVYAVPFREHSRILHETLGPFVLDQTRD